MKTFKTVADQGEIYITRIGDVPKKAKLAGKPLQPENGRFIIGHSETGHHHVLDRVEGVKVSVLPTPPDSEGIRILRAILENPTKLEHQRPHDTHETILLEPGEYEFRLRREYDPYAELARQSRD